MRFKIYKTTRLHTVLCMSLKHIVSQYWSKLGSGNLRTTHSQECLNLKEKKEQQVDENCTKPKENMHNCYSSSSYMQ